MCPFRYRVAKEFRTGPELSGPELLYCACDTLVSWHPLSQRLRGRIDLAIAVLQRSCCTTSRTANSGKTQVMLHTEDLHAHMQASVRLCSALMSPSPRRGDERAHLTIDHRRTSMCTTMLMPRWQSMRGSTRWRAVYSFVDAPPPPERTRKRTSARMCRHPNHQKLVCSENGLQKSFMIK